MGFTNRRQFLTQTAALPVVSGLWRAPESTDFFDSQPGSVHSYRQELPGMLLSFIAKKTNSHAKEWDQVRSGPQAAAELEERNRFVREMIIAVLGGFPPRNPLSPVVTRVVSRDSDWKCLLPPAVVFLSSTLFGLLDESPAKVLDRGCVDPIVKPVWVQRGRSYDSSIVPQVRIDLRNLGYPPLDVIPPDESASRALAVGPDGRLYGAISGKRSHLFLLDPQHGYVEPMGTLADAKVVHRPLVVGQQGRCILEPRLPSILTPKGMIATRAATC